jgi:AcrR family transcriptional regulator
MTRIVKEYEERRGEILQAAQVLFYTQGYDNTSVQNIIDAVGIAKGTFYHYFDSKQDLLDELVAFTLQYTVGSLEAMVYDPQIKALDKLQRFFSDAQTFKLENKEVVQTLLEVWYKNENAILREKLKAEASLLASPMLAHIIRQGLAEGDFDCDSADDLAVILIAISQGLSEMLVKLMVESELDRDFMQVVLQKIAVYERAIEKLLGAPSGSLVIISSQQVENWFALAAHQPEHRSVPEMVHVSLEQEGI